MKRMPLILLLFLPLAFWSCQKDELNIFPASDPRLSWHGRVYADPSGDMLLAGSASSLKFRFYGPQCRIWLKNAAYGSDYNYISLVLDGSRQSRKAITGDTLTVLDIRITNDAAFHDIELYKETEAVIGQVVIHAIETDSLESISHPVRKKIEFIGNSITVGMSSDESVIPCGSGTWYDQHNAYDAYGPRIARALNMEYTVTGFSGIGIYRNTRSDRPVMTDIYESAFLSPDPRSARWNFKNFIPDVVSISLGTNDFSAGDGMTARPPFDSTQFINSYLSFLKMVHTHYPDAHIIITNTPMLDAPKNHLLVACLEKIKSRAAIEITGIKPVSIFTFSRMYTGGCYGHPSVAEHEKMAEEMVAFLKGMSL